MSFYGSSFIFNGVPSEFYDLKIYSFDSSNPKGTDSANADIKEQWLYRRETPYFYGRYYQSVLEFDFTVGSYSAIDGTTRNAIQKWLLGKSTYLPLRIVQDDIADISFNVILTKSTNLYIGNLNYAMTLHARCDRPWGIYTPPDFIRTYASGSLSGSPIDDTITYTNSSVYDGYNKPTITITMREFDAGYVTITNLTDDPSRQFSFTNLDPNEVITVDNDKGVITSSGSSLRMANFVGKNFLRLVQGVNDLNIVGTVKEIKISSVFSKGVGV